MLEATNVSLSHGTRLAVDRASLSVGAGELVVICGPNGAGKSSFLAALTGDATPMFGQVRLAGRKLEDHTPAALGLCRAVLEQSPSLSVAFTVAELAALGLSNRISPDDVATLTRDVIDRLNLQPFLNRPVLELSGGERHRAHLARVLIQLEAGRLLGHGHALFLDEPTASLDIAHQITVMEQARFMARRGVAVVIILHDLNLASAFADRVVLMSDARIAVDGAPSRVLTARQLGQIYKTSFSIESGPDNRPRVFPDYTSPREVPPGVVRALLR